MRYIKQTKQPKQIKSDCKSISNESITSNESEIKCKIREKKTKHNVNQAMRKLVWLKHIGNKFYAYCWCCNSTLINPFEFECGHVLSRSNGGKDTVSNLRPICRLCNGSMGTKHLVEFQKEHGLVRFSFYNFIKKLFYH
jgi:hypothetical protein